MFSFIMNNSDIKMIPQHIQMVFIPKLKDKIPPTPAPIAKITIIAKNCNVFIRSVIDLFLINCARNNVPLLRFPIHIVLAYLFLLNMRKDCTCIAHAKDTVILAALSYSSGRSPTTKRSRNMIKRTICRQWIFLLCFNLISIKFDRKTPATKAKTGNKWSVASCRFPSMKLWLISTTLPVWALAKTWSLTI